MKLWEDGSHGYWAVLKHSWMLWHVLWCSAIYGVPCGSEAFSDILRCFVTSWCVLFVWDIIWRSEVFWGILRRVHRFREVVKDSSTFRSILWRFIVIWAVLVCSKRLNKGSEALFDILGISKSPWRMWGVLWHCGGFLTFSVAFS